MLRSTARSSQVASGDGGWRTKCAQIIGVSVSDTTIEIAMAKTSVTENSRNTRPITPVMNSSGMNAAISEMLIETTVKPIWRAPSSAACTGVMPFSRLRKQFSIITMASSTTKPTETTSAISDRLLIENPADPHQRAGAGERERHGDAGGDGRRAAAQEQEHHHHHQRDRDHQRELHVEHAGADGLGAVGEDVDVDAGGDPAA